MSNTVLRSVRIEEELDKWFNDHFPWRGSLPQFINEALRSFKDEWGDRLPPHEVLEKAIAKLAPKFPP